MQIKTTFPHPVREIENTWIPLADGKRLAARIWLPEDAASAPVPAILEYIPYRKNDGTALRDSLQHPYMAGHGYACVRVDMRGSGDSDGILYDEYLPQEQDDAVEIISWLAAQPWCNGAVGMMGKSWGGFNSLQVAARRPSALKAIITVCSTDDRYADDVHYMGGCLLASDMLAWASNMLTYNAQPPDPRFVGERWREMWLERMEKSPPFVEAWVSHQRRDAFWQHGSVCQNYADIVCPVYAIGGWADGYSNAIPRLLAGLNCPRKGLIGPWTHEYPERALPEPAIGFLQECLRWWDYWLKEIDTGIMDEPMLRAWLHDSVPPQTHYTFRPGHWVAEPAWPGPNITPQHLYLNNQSLDPVPSAETLHRIETVLTHGLDGGIWCPYGKPGDMPGDQRTEDGLACCFTSPPLNEPVEILGFPIVTLSLSANQPAALVAVRLCDVAPSGTSTLVSRGLLNLTHRQPHGHDNPQPLKPGQFYTVSVELNAVGHILPAGHCWRIAVAPAYWPFAWPSPQPVTLTIRSGEHSFLALPLRSPQPLDQTLTPFALPETSQPLPREILRPSSRSRTVQRDLISGQVQLVDHIDDGQQRFTENGLEQDSTLTDTFTIIAGDPLSAVVECIRSIKTGRGDWQTRLETTSRMSADAEQFHITNLLNAYEGNTCIFTKSWSFSVVRDFV